MKHFTLSVLGSFFALFAIAQSQTSIDVLGQNDEQITVRFEVDDFTSTVIQTEDGEAQLITLDEGTQLLRAGAPDVPKLTASLLVDHKAKMAVEVISSSYTEYQDVEIAPSKGNIYRDVNIDEIAYTKGEAYVQDAFYPGELASLRDAYVYREYRGQTVVTYPVQYNPVTKVLRVYDQITVQVVETEEIGENAFEPNSAQVTQEQDFLYKNHFLNYNGSPDRYDQIEEMGGILVISDAEYMETIDPWVLWKIQKGHPVTVVDVADIGNTYQEIGDYIADFYTENDIAFVQLVGDEDQVASQLISNGGGPGYCDPCYTFIEGNDHYPEVMLGRFLVHDNDELIPVIEKTLEYEKTPDTEEEGWFSSAIGMGSNEGAGAGDDNQADWQHINGLKEVLLDFTYEEVWEMNDGNHTADSPTGGETADQSGNPTSNDIFELVDQGVSILNYAGHGWHDGVVTGNYTSDDINNQTNMGKYPYFIVVGCCVGDFDEADGPGDCFGEVWLKATNGDGQPTGGIGGSFSSVLQSWAPPMEGQDEMNNLIGMVGDYEIRHTFGGIHYNGCAKMVDEYGSGGEEMMDTWCIFGDATTVIRTAYPDAITLDYDEEIFIGTDEIEVTCNTEGALICITVGDQILGTAFVEGGIATITLDEAIEDVYEMVVTATSLNTIPFQGDLMSVPAEGPWVVDELVEVDDALGNVNDLADYMESILLDVTLENVGIELGDDVEATISTANTYVTITDDYHFYGDIEAGATALENGAYAFDVANNVPDQEVVLFDMVVTDANDNVWTPNFTVVMNAPELDTAEDIDVDDATGNGNGRLDNSETADLVIPSFNFGHAASLNATGTLSTTSSWVTINNPTVDLGVIDIDGDVEAIFEVTVEPNAPDGEEVDFVYTVTAGEYSATRTYTEVLNLIMEDWETGDDNMFDWEYSGNQPWFIQASTVYEGDFAMQSGNIGNSAETTLELTIDVTTPGNVEFAVQTSTEGGWDFLYFRVDNVTVEEWSGENAWVEVGPYPLTVGQHTLRWTYEKDQIISGGQDACWVDDIILPPHTGVADFVTEIKNTSNIVAYPNPTSENVWIDYTAINNSQLVVRAYNEVGALVFDEQITTTIGLNRFKLPSDAWASGLYNITFMDGNSMETLKLIVD